MDRNVRSAGALRRALGDLSLGAGAPAGARLVEFLQPSARSYAEGAQNAALLARSTNASVAEASRLHGLVRTLGRDSTRTRTNYRVAQSELVTESCTVRHMSK